MLKKIHHFTIAGLYVLATIIPVATDSISFAQLFWLFSGWKGSR